MPCSFKTPAEAATELVCCLKTYLWPERPDYLIGFDPFNGRDCCERPLVAISLDGKATNDLANEVGITGGPPCEIEWHQDLKIEFRNCWSFSINDDGTAPDAGPTERAYLALADQMWDVANHVAACFCATLNCEARVTGVAGVAPNGACAGWDIEIRVPLHPCGC